MKLAYLFINLFMHFSNYHELFVKIIVVETGFEMFWVFLNEVEECFDDIEALCDIAFVWYLISVAFPMKIDRTVVAQNLAVIASVIYSWLGTGIALAIKSWVSKSIVSSLSKGLSYLQIVCLGFCVCSILNKIINWVNFHCFNITSNQKVELLKK